MERWHFLDYNAHLNILPIENSSVAAPTLLRQ
jgi:hypothetical protein